MAENQAGLASISRSLLIPWGSLRKNRSSWLVSGLGTFKPDTNTMRETKGVTRTKKSNWSWRSALISTWNPFGNTIFKPRRRWRDDRSELAIWKMRWVIFKLNIERVRLINSLDIYYSNSYLLLSLQTRSNKSWNSGLGSASSSQSVLLRHSR